VADGENAIIWLRRDLRLDDHPALQHALANGLRPVLLYIHAPDEEAPWAPGAASRWWLHHSLQALSEAVRARGGKLILRAGPTRQTLLELIDESGAKTVCWQRLYDPVLVARDSTLKRELRERGIDARSFSGYLLAEPDHLRTQAGDPYRVFTPFWRQLQGRLDQLDEALPAPVSLPPSKLGSLNVAELGLLPKIPWYSGLDERWTPGEAGAEAALQAFQDDALADYARARDLPATSGTSRLSPHLHFGEISVRRIARRLAGQVGAEPYLRELGWRDFSHHLLRHFPATPEENLNRRFDAFPWAEPEPEQRVAWQRGRTGIPIVDAGMRELWQTGWMHNRVRMITASLLTKNLRCHWSVGARWFWDTLVDANLGNNTQGWQWTAGTGADAAPYFRIFNPVSQGERFDPKGDYVRRWVPELAQLAPKQIHQPWSGGGVRGYPAPIVDLRGSRAEALAAFQTLRREPAPADG
jgi:deoxyribodipyrimidine photo-lyase